MNDIVTAATKVAKRFRDSGEDPSPSEIASAVDEATDEDQNPSALEQYAKKAALIGTVALVRRYLSDEGQGIDEDATRVEVVDPDEREASAAETESASEESSGGLLSLKRVLFLGVLAGAGYAAVKKLRSGGEQQTLEEWDEPSTATESGSATADTSASSDASEDVSDHDVDIGAGEAEDESESGTTTDPTEVADGESVGADDNEAADVEDNEAIGVDDDTVAAEPDEVAVEEDVAEEAENEDEDEDEDERLSQSE